MKIAASHVSASPNVADLSNDHIVLPDFMLE